MDSSGAPSFLSWEGGAPPSFSRKVGALPPRHGKVRLYMERFKDGDGVCFSNSTSLWQEERASMEWLDATGPPPPSCTSASAASRCMLKREELLVLWHGLVNSGYHFLWVVRPGLLVNGGVPAEVAKEAEERGLLVEWAPQQELLAHPAVGCFLTHGGCNSALEWAGVPMVCWPYFADQRINSRFVSEVWGIGVDIKYSCDRAVVEEAVREVMAGERGSQMKRVVSGISKMARECVEEGGSSYMNLETLIRDIGDMSLKRHKSDSAEHRELRA